MLNNLFINANSYQDLAPPFALSIVLLLFSWYLFIKSWQARWVGTYKNELYFDMKSPISEWYLFFLKQKTIGVKIWSANNSFNYFHSSYIIGNCYYGTMRFLFYSTYYYAAISSKSCCNTLEGGIFGIVIFNFNLLRTTP